MKTIGLVAVLALAACGVVPKGDLASSVVAAAATRDAATATLDVVHPGSVPAAWADKSNPFGYDDPAIGETGKAGYVAHCAGCHGIDGHGHDGAAPDLHKANLLHSDAYWFWRIDAGKGQMPAFGDTLNDESIWRIVTYARWNFTQF